jgi:PAS domain S-box-containing protein
MIRRIVKRFRNISITKKLYFVIGVMALLIAIELFALWFSLNTLSSVRAFVGGEGLWSKAQKDAIYNLQKYARTYNNDDYLNFQNFMKVPLGDHKTLAELNKKNPDIENAKQGFLEGRNHRKDIDGMIKLFQRFHDIYYIKRAISIWIEADSTIAELIPIGEKLHSEINSSSPSEDRIDAIIAKIDPLNQKLTVLEDDFSYTLGEGSRWLERIILKILFFIALTVELSGLVFTISVSIEISKGINNIISVSKKIAKEDFSDRAQIYSADEIGQLANSFNQMASDLDEKRKEEKLTAEILTKKSKQLAEAQQLAHIGSWELNTSDLSIKWSDELYRIYGVMPENFIPTVEKFMEFIHPDDAEHVIKIAREHYQTKKSLNYYYRIIRPSGEIRFINGRGEPVFDEQGNLIRAIGTIQDVTEMKQTEDSLKLQTALYETLLRAQSEMGEGVAITQEKKIIYANSALCEMYGYSEKEILSMSSFIDLVVEADKERLTKRLQQRLFEEHSPETGETSIIRKDGRIIDIAYSLKVIQTGDKTQVVSIVRDITEKNRDAELLKINAERLEQSNKDLEQFAYVASHDLREPLRTISSYVQLLESRYKNKLDDEANEFINYTVDGVQRMDKLINDLLTYSRVSRKHEVDWIDCSEILKTVTININDIIQENKVNITVGKLPRVLSNTLQMTQLFQNLIANAIKFNTAKSPEIHISAEELEKEWLFSIQDNGIGIDKKYSEKIFVIFQRLHSRETYEGTGIGLAICKKIIEQHEGKIWFESKLGQGTTFYFTIKKSDDLIS